MFVDISGFTALSERLARKGKLGAEEVTAVLNRVFTELLTIAVNRGGDLLKFGGDALLLWYRGEGHAPRAAAAAHEMRTALRTVGKIDTPAGRVNLRMSVGIHSGDFDFFLLGSSHHELLIAGPATTATVQMESGAEAGQILVSRATAEHLPSQALGEPSGNGMLLRRAPEIDGAVDESAAPSTDNLEQLIPSALRQAVGSTAIEGEHRRATVAFIEFTGSDALIRAGGCGSAVGALESIINAAQESADEFGVTFLYSDIDADGGKLILIGGVPAITGHDEASVLLAARQTADRAQSLPLKIGVNRGSLFAADVGAPFRRAFTIIGDAVNLAARVMSHAGQNQILVTPGVLEYCTTVFETTPVEPFRVKGKSHPVEAVQLGKPTGSAERSDEHELPLIGRKEELATATAAIADLIRGKGQLVEVIGEPGIGKSRFTEEVATRARADGVTLYRSVCVQYESATPYAALRMVLRGLVGIEDEPGPALERLVRERAPHLDDWLPLIAVPFDAEVATTEAADELDPSFRKPRTFDAVRDLLQSVVSSPSLVVIEDAHWMDEASAELLANLEQSLGSLPLTVFVTRREAGTGFVSALPHSTIALEALTLGDATELADVLADELMVPPHLVAEITRRADGNPLFLIELVAASRDQRTLESLPDTVETLVASRVDSLPPDERQALQYASVAGLEAPLELLEQNSPQVFELLSHPARWQHLADFIEPSAPGAVTFKHTLYRDVAYEQLPFRIRRSIHAHIGSTIEQRAGTATDEDAEILALHFDRAQIFTKAWDYARLAGRNAASKGANVDAAKFFAQAIRNGRRADDVDRSELAPVAETLGDVYDLAGLYAEADDAYVAARKLVATDPIAQARLMRKQGLMRERKGSYSAALRWLSRAMKVLDRGTSDQPALIERSELQASYSGVCFRQARYRNSVEWALRSIEPAKAAGYQEGLAHAYYLLDHAMSFLGDPQAETYRKLALPIYEKLGDHVGQSRVLNNLGVNAYFRGDWEAAVRFYERSREEATKAGDVLSIARAASNIGEILSDQGRLGEAEAAFRQARRVWRASRYTVGVALADANLGRAAARAGRHDEAEQLLEQSVQGFQEIGAETFVLEAEARRIENRILAGDDTALDLASHHLGRTRATDGTAVLQAMLERLTGLAYLQRDDPDSARRHLADSLRIAREAGADYEVAQTLQVLGRLTDHPDADAHRNESTEIMQRLGIGDPVTNSG